MRGKERAACRSRPSSRQASDRRSGARHLRGERCRWWACWRAEEHGSRLPPHAAGQHQTLQPPSLSYIGQSLSRWSACRCASAGRPTANRRSRQKLHSRAGVGREGSGQGEHRGKAGEPRAARGPKLLCQLVSCKVVSTCGPWLPAPAPSLALPAERMAAGRASRLVEQVVADGAGQLCWIVFVISILTCRSTGFLGPATLGRHVACARSRGKASSRSVHGAGALRRARL